MNCEDITPLLHEFADAELEEEIRVEVRDHLLICADCRKAQEDIARVKRLVQMKTFQPPLPGGLSARISRNIHHQARLTRLATYRRMAYSAAASLVLAVSGWLVYVGFFQPPTPLAHAAAMGEMVEYFNALTGAGFPVHDRSSLAATIHRKTGIQIGEIPELPDSTLVGWNAAIILERKCVRLDYDVDDAKGERPDIVIFVMPRETLESPHLAFCECIAMTGTHIYCLGKRNSGMSLSACSSLPRHEIERRMLALNK